MRRTLLAGNWKMNKAQAEAGAFFHDLDRELGSTPVKADILFAVPFTLLERAKQAAAACHHSIHIAAQNVHWESHGAYTGEVSIGMLKDIGIYASLVGHSERRQYFGESNDTVGKKVAACLAQGLTPIACVGETRAEREAGRMQEVVSAQMLAILKYAGSQNEKLIIAYEPVWAIGTGLTATDTQAQEVHHLIRGQIASILGSARADTMTILYGGSANPANIAGLLTQKDIDGGLVGGASLKAKDFAAMVRAVK